MRPRVTRYGALGLVVALLVFATAGCGGSSASKTAIAGLSEKKLSAGSIEVTVTPRQLDAQGARFDIALDTHSGDLGTDLARAARLSVGGRQWPTARWSGDGPGGHHRGGTLAFSPGGAASGPVRLVIAGLPAPVVLEWTR